MPAWSLPPAWPAITTMLVLIFMWTWNDFFGPLIYLDDPEKFTVALALAFALATTHGEGGPALRAHATFEALSEHFRAEGRCPAGLAVEDRDLAARGQDQGAVGRLGGPLFQAGGLELGGVGHERFLGKIGSGRAARPPPGARGALRGQGGLP